MQNQGNAVLPTRQQSTLFLALTFVVIIIVALLSPDAATALVAIGLLLGLGLACGLSLSRDLSAASCGPSAASCGPSAATRVPSAATRGPSAASCGPSAATRGPSAATRTPRQTSTTEGFCLPDVGFSAASHRGPAQCYPGAIDIDEYDTEPGYGHRDRAEYDNDAAPEGNPFNLNRVAAPWAAGACIDDEAYGDEMDGDERLNYQARSRNDPTRAVAGTMNRRRDLDKYLREEVEEEEGRVWWGRHED